MCYALAMSSTIADARSTGQSKSGHHDRLARRLAEDPGFKAEFKRQQRTIAAIDNIVNQLDTLRSDRAYSKAELARKIDKNPASVRRLLTAATNPELGTIVAVADALDADVVVVPRKKRLSRPKDHASAA